MYVFLPQLIPGTPLPPPASLRRKILIKNKKKHHKPKTSSCSKSDNSTFHVPVESPEPVPETASPPQVRCGGISV